MAKTTTKSAAPPTEATEVPAAAGKDEVSALARGLAVMKAVGDAAGPMSNRELVEATGIPKATVSRLAATLVASGYLRQADDTERFSLGPALLGLSTRYLHHFDLRAVARPHLAALAEFAGVSVHMGIRDGLDMLVIESIRPRSAVITSRTDVGSRMTIATSAAGRAYLATLPEPERDELLERIRLESGENWAALQPRIRHAIKEHAARGYCSSFGEWHPHIHALGFSLRGPRGERYAVSCGGPAHLLPRETMIGRIGPRLLDTMRQINADIGNADGLPVES